MKEPQKPQNPSETVKMLPHQPQPQLEHVVSMLENAKDLLDQHKTPEKTLPKVSMQTEIRYGGYMLIIIFKNKNYYVVRNAG